MSRYRFGIWPKARPLRHPAKWTDWLRPVAVLAAAVLVAGLVTGGPWLWKRLSCKDGWPSTDVWSAGGECVGLSAGGYDFGLPAFTNVLKVIEGQNASAADVCDPKGTPVTVGVLLTMTDQYAGARAVHELEGMAAGQARANSTGCLHPLRLVVGNIGAYAPEQEAVQVARRLADRPEVVAVAGIGLSNQRSAEIADLLAAAKIPMVSDLITAEGFDQSGSTAQETDYSGCEPDTTYQNGVGRDHYYRVAYRGSEQIRALGAALSGARLDFIMVPTGGTDPYTCTALPLMHKQFGGDITEVKFDPDEASTVSQTAQRVCNVAKDVTVGYIARGRDLAMFLHSLDQEFTEGHCSASSITVVSTSDGQRVRAAELDPRLEDLRVRALSSPSFTSGKLRLVSTLVGGADKQVLGNTGFTDFERHFTRIGFDVAHTDAGWAVNGYDALAVIEEAVNKLPVTREVQRSQVNTQISFVSSPETAVLGAGGPIMFDNDGNRVGPPPPVVRVCPLPPQNGTVGRVRSVTLQPAGPAPSC
ncbi:ABC transporter substrate-binding protein [Saccharothrix longispora]|uniref:ABC transporter substrate-binding protein n=1 Tax=Saccharothrix longispora TaxID=33920 RepID=UPI0028FD0459|nr:ABC transporter substrate-binding protein [Saccharothrix longispora]MDU0292410.1 ABC transporter substrate-binding protein [Saccharothrix longispora]